MNSLFSLPFINTTESELPTSVFKRDPQDFKVTELMGVEPSGEGEHIWLKVQKEGKNTQDIARDLSRHFNVAKHAVSYSGLKDKNAITEQWFSVHIPGKSDPSLPVFRGVNFIAKSRHNKKLKTGSHDGNHFVITLRDISDLESVESNLERVQEKGFPNYFGHQRFGFDRGNLTGAQNWLESGKRPRQRFLEGMYLSALRSYIFNITLSERISLGTWDTLVEDEIAQFDWSKSGFVVEDVTDSRCASGEVHPAVNLFDGNHKLPDSLLELSEQAWFSKLRNKRFSPEQRALRVIPRALSWDRINDTDIEVRFELPRGSYATSLLKEVSVLIEPDRGNLDQSSGALEGDL
jgi:tRNA pseudouridine13 synthase